MGLVPPKGAQSSGEAGDLAKSPRERHLTRQRGAAGSRHLPAAQGGCSGVAGLHVVRVSANTASSRRVSRDKEGPSPSVDRSSQYVGAGAVQKKFGRRGPEQSPRRDHVAAIARVLLRPDDWLDPRPLEVRPGRSVVERLSALAPTTLERNPREVAFCSCCVARDCPHDRTQVDGRARRVVAANTLRRTAAEVERFLSSSRAIRRPDGRPVRPIDELEFLVVPRCPLRPLVLAIARLDRLAGQRAGRLIGVGRPAGSSPSRPRACC